MKLSPSKVRIAHIVDDIESIQQQKSESLAGFSAVVEDAFLELAPRALLCRRFFTGIAIALTPGVSEYE